MSLSKLKDVPSPRGLYVEKQDTENVPYFAGLGWQDE